MKNKPLNSVLALALCLPFFAQAQSSSYADELFDKWIPGLDVTAQPLPIEIQPVRRSLPPGLCQSLGQGDLVERDNLASFSSPRIYPEHVYDDLFDRCVGLINDLENARRRAGLVGNRNLKQAANIMFNALKNAYIEVMQGQVVAAPQVSMAIVEGYHIANIYQAHLPSKTPVGSQRVDQAYIKFINDVYNMIIFAYDELDQKHFSSFKEVCLRGRYCYNERNNPHDFFNSSYFDHTRQLAVKVIDLYIDNAEETGKDSVELPLAAVVAGSAMNILNESVYRRDFSCDIVELWNIKSLAQRYTCRANHGIPLHDIVNEVRYSISEVYQNLKAKSRGRSNCRQRRKR